MLPFETWVTPVFESRWQANHRPHSAFTVLAVMYIVLLHTFNMYVSWYPSTCSQQLLIILVSTDSTLTYLWYFAYFENLDNPNEILLLHFEMLWFELGVNFISFVYPLCYLGTLQEPHFMYYNCDQTALKSFQAFTKVKRGSNKSNKVW
jgi:hypothetical protein